MNVKQIIRFLFPEYQIIESIKQYGFIARKKHANIVSNTVLKSSVKINSPQSQSISEEQQTVQSKYQNKYMQSRHTQADEPHYKNKNTTKAKDIPHEKPLSSIEKKINLKFIGQPDAIQQLMVAFKRPAIRVTKETKPRNTIFISGQEHCGKSTLIKTVVTELKDAKLINYAAIYTIDLALYATPTDENIFLSDLYEALYNPSDVVVFKNYHQSHSSFISVISKLVCNGKYKLGNRYTLQGNNLILTNGILMQNSISEISSNRKYFVFLTNDNESKIYEFWGARFMESVRDIITIGEYDDAALLLIIDKKLIDLQEKCKSNLKINISDFIGVRDFLLKQYNKRAGISGVEKGIQDQIYEPLTEYKLRDSAQAFSKITISVKDDELVITDKTSHSTVAIALSKYKPKKYNNLDEIRIELDNVVGLGNVKQYVLDLENNYKVQKMRETAGYKTASISKHMIFIGNPGTGKTTIARLIAKYLKAIGVLSIGQLKEVTRSDLVGQYVGHTAKLCNDVIKSAIGGVLFIDEAYSLCRNKNDMFGLEAVDALVKGMEDCRDDIVVILAGYQDEMGEFLKSNSGLASRFPNHINFEDYTPSEMLQIAHIIAKDKGYKINPACESPLCESFEKSQIKGKNDSGNGRLVRNIIEAAILEQSKRITASRECDLSELLPSDFKFDKVSNFDLEAELSKIIGLDHVKEFVRTQQKILVANEKRKKASLKVDTSQTLNMVFIGNPGTGKTMIARLVAAMLKNMGMLKSGQLIETDRAGLVSEYAGQTAIKTTEVFHSALGGVLFIDEAYSLSTDGSSFGKEAIDTLVKLIEDYRGEIVVILAGYKKEMTYFMNANSGLSSRFPLNIDFPDYSCDELIQIAYRMIDNKGFLLDDSAKPVLIEQIKVSHRSATPYSGNGRMMRNIVEEIIRNQSARVAMSDVKNEELSLIFPCDIHSAPLIKNYDLDKALEKIIGLNEVKDYVRSLSARLKIQSERKKMGLPVDEAQTLHMIFKGNPGTGKTMIARTVAEVLFHIGIIRSSKLVETDRAGLVAGYVGQTALKTTQKIKEAFDGVLFIDEAYALSQGGQNDFGRESIDTLVKLMDDNRDRLVVILAGYSENMDAFLKTNPGLKSRFPNIIEFPDYTIDELLCIASAIYCSKGYYLDDQSLSKLQKIFSVALKEPAFGNGRYVRNIAEKSINQQALRLSKDEKLTKDDLMAIKACDIEEG